jgi:hypothetical protein
MFPAIVAISPGLGDDAGFQSVADCLRREFAANRTVLRQLVLTAGDQESRLYASAIRLRDFVRDSAPPNWRMTFVDGAGLGHTDTPFTGIPAGIRFVQAAAVWEMPAAQGDSVRSAKGDEPAQRMDAFYRSLSARVGYTVPPSAKWLRTVATLELSHAEYAKGLATAQRLTEQFPEDLAGWGTLTEACVRNSDNACARRALNDALRMVDKMDFFDEEGRAQQKKLLSDNLRALSQP